MKDVRIRLRIYRAFSESEGGKGLGPCSLPDKELLCIKHHPVDKNDRSRKGGVKLVGCGSDGGVETRNHSRERRDDGVGKTGKTGSDLLHNIRENNADIVVGWPVGGRSTADSGTRQSRSRAVK